MNKLLIIITFTLSLIAEVIPTSHTTLREFRKYEELNAKIIQLSNASQSIMSQVGGHIEKYFVKAGQNVKKGQKIVLIESMMISKMTAEFISLKKQLFSQQKNYEVSKNLYEKGMTSMQELNSQSIKKDELLAKLTALKSQLETLRIDTKNIKDASPNYFLYAHSDGIVSSILQPLHSTIREETPIISLVKKQAFYLKSYLPLKYADKVKIGQKIVINNSNKNIISHVTQILPKLDEKTQRIVILSSIDTPNRLYINTYLSATIYFDATKKYIAIKKSALSFFNNEWVVFLPKEHGENDEHSEHEEHDKHEEHGEHEEDEEHDKHEEHGEHEEDENSSYDIRVVKVITQDEKFVAVEGLELGEEYVSAKSYFVKSLLLKSSLGGHGH